MNGVWVMIIGVMLVTRENLRTGRKTGPCATFNSYKMNQFQSDMK
jgi:hypothetical protein